MVTCAVRGTPLTHIRYIKEPKDEMCPLLHILELPDRDGLCEGASEVSLFVFPGQSSSSFLHPSEIYR